MILLITIVLVVTAAILQWATPILQRSQNEANYGAVLGYFNALDSTFEDVVNMGEGASRTVDVSVGAGNIYISEIMNETWVVSYGFEGQPRVNFSGLDYPQDNKFHIEASILNANVSVYWYDENNNIIHTFYKDSVGLPNDITTDEIVSGTVNITVFDSSHQIVAQLWLFDITPITYELPSAFGTYYIKEVNGGIITQATGQKYVTNEPLVKETGSSLLLYMIQTKATNLRGGGSGSYSFTLNMKNMNIRNNMSRDVYNLTLQIYNEQEEGWNDAWYSYFLTGWRNAKISGKEMDYTGFVSDEGGDGLLYKTNNTTINPELYGTTPITLRLMSCNMDVNMKST
ncbi:MAG: hypothetical protein L6265_05695, partial [Thermoplasmatales archaeon]|nr:hypothetical protein [Thermoplasmatales archaeon]